MGVPDSVAIRSAPVLGSLQRTRRIHVRALHHPEEVAHRYGLSGHGIPCGDKHPQKGEVGVMKTLAIRLEDEQHARLSILAKLSDQSVTDVIRQAIDERLTHLAADPEVSAKAEALTAQIEKDAAEQRAAIADLFDTTAAASSRSRKS